MSERRVDPADVVHRRGRWWPPEALDPPAGVSDHGCRRGWLAETPDDARPIPCPRCKPHLAGPATDDQHDHHEEDDHDHQQP